MNQNTQLLRAVENSALAEMDEMRRRIDSQHDEALCTHLYAQLSEYRAIQYHAAQKLSEGGHVTAPNPLQTLRSKKPSRLRRKVSAIPGGTDITQTLLQCPTAATDVRELAYQLLRTQRKTVR